MPHLPIPGVSTNDYPVASFELNLETNDGHDKFGVEFGVLPQKVGL